jgi:hypothetical protein
MRIALCISGQPRGLIKNTQLLLDNVILPNNIQDIFIHTWYDKSLDNVPFDSAQPSRSSNLGSWLPDSDSYLVNILKPKKILCEKPKQFDEFSNLVDLPTAIQKKLCSNFYSVWKSNELKKEYEIENGFKYDLVIKTRIDINYFGAVKLLDLIDEDIHNSIYVPRLYQEMRQNDSYPTKSGEKYSSLSDTFAFGSSVNIDKFSSVYPNFNLIYDEITPFAYGEAYLGYQVRHIHKLNIKMKEINYIISR